MAPPFVMLTETGSLDGNVSSTAPSSFLFRFCCDFSGRALSVPGTMSLLGRLVSLVRQGRAAQLLNQNNPADRGTGRCCTRSRSHLTHLRSHIRRNLPGFPLSALIRSHCLRSHRSSEEKSRPKPPVSA